MDKALIGHIQMCVRLKLRKDEKQKNRDNKIQERINRGYAALAILRQMKSDEG